MGYNELATTDFQDRKKINAKYAGIVSRPLSRLNFPEEDFFEILYFDNDDNQWHCGFGSYTFSFVSAWLKSEFEPTYNRLGTAITDLLARAEAAEARAEKAERERDAAVKYIRHYGWCAGCKYFRGVRGCAGHGLKNCTEQNDYYEFGQKEE